jgi:hypothetical protein
MFKQNPHKYTVSIKGLIDLGKDKRDELEGKLLEDDPNDYSLKRGSFL